MRTKDSRAVLRGLGRSNAPQLPGEVEYLAKAEDRWGPFALPPTNDPIGEIHAQAYAIRIYPDVMFSTRQIVTLIPDA